jgi:hypothetical protein
MVMLSIHSELPRIRAEYVGWVPALANEISTTFSGMPWAFGLARALATRVKWSRLPGFVFFIELFVRCGSIMTGKVWGRLCPLCKHWKAAHARNHWRKPICISETNSGDSNLYHLERRFFTETFCPNASVMWTPVQPTSATTRSPQLPIFRGNPLYRVRRGGACTDIISIVGLLFPHRWRKFFFSLAFQAFRRQGRCHLPRW